MTFECLCGGVTIETETKPDFVHDCNCSLCTKSGALWGYFSPDQVDIAGVTKGFKRADKNPASVEVFSCLNCGATTHFAFSDEIVVERTSMMVGVNVRLADPADLAGVEVRFPDGRSWDGVGEFSYVRATCNL